MALVTPWSIGTQLALIVLAFSAPIVVLLALLVGESTPSVALGVHARERIRYLEPAVPDARKRQPSGIAHLGLTRPGEMSHPVGAFALGAPTA